MSSSTATPAIRCSGLAIYPLGRYVKRRAHSVKVPFCVDQVVRHTSHQHCVRVVLCVFALSSLAVLTVALEAAAAARKVQRSGDRFIALARERGHADAH